MSLMTTVIKLDYWIQYRHGPVVGAVYMNKKTADYLLHANQSSIHNNVIHAYGVGFRHEAGVCLQTRTP